MSLRSMGFRDFALMLDQSVVANERIATRVFQRVGFTCAGSVIVGDPPYSPGTPVDTGLARGSWHTQLADGGGFGIGLGGEEGAPDKSGTRAMSEAEAVIARAKLGQTIWLTNGVDYILDLENGTSQQAPQGMVRMTLAAGEEILRDEIAAENQR